MRCRLCLYECDKKNILALFDDGEESHLNKLITKYMHLEITEDDNCSTMICRNCEKHLKEFHEFYLFIEERQTELQNEFLEVKCILNQDVGLAADDVTAEVTRVLCHNEESLLDIKEILVEGAMHPSAITQEEFGFAENNICTEENGFDKSCENESTSDVDEDDENVPLTRLVTRNKAVLTKHVKIITKKRGRPKKIKGKTKMESEVATKNVNTKAASKQHNFVDSKLQDELIEKHMRLKCEICDITIQTMHDLRTHFRQLHNMKAFVVCCGRRFHRRFILLDHLKLHLDPEHFKCEICSKVLNSNACLRNHIATFHSDVLERKHVCTVCDRRFAHSNNLNSHMLTHTDVKDHICDICNKGFKSIPFLKKHILHVHENIKPYVCEICGQDYKNKQFFDRHVAEHNGIPNQLTEQCPQCQKWFRPNGLRFHMLHHDVKDVNCTFCNKTLKSRGALKAHIRYWHRKGKSFKCTYCEREFKKPCVLKEHIALHTGRKDYSCPHCPRDFRSKANMYAHVKKLHVEEWKKAQLAKNRGPTELVEKLNATE